MDRRIETKHIVILVPAGSTLLTTVGPLEVFAKSIEQFDIIRKKVNFRYETHVVSMGQEKMIESSSGLSILSEGSYEEIDYPVDTLIVTGLARYMGDESKEKMIEWLRLKSGSIRRICSVCSGAFVLAETGLLNGKKATAHWSKNEELSLMYPEIDVQIARIFIKDGKMYTAAGITSGMDLALALIEEDLGQAFALHVARWLVLFLKRPGNQSQFNTYMDCKKIGNPAIRRVCEWILEHLREDLVVEDLAEYAAMSPRNFARVFVRELRITPAKYINRLRVDNACQHLIETQMSLDEIADYCGLKTAENLRRHFLSLLEISPAQYRKNFQSSWCDLAV